MTELNKIINYLDITVLNIELYTAGKEWSFQNKNDPYSRIYYITEGYGTIQHHNRTYKLLPGHLYLIPCYTTVNMFCPEQFSHYYVHFTSLLQTGPDILSLFECSYQTALVGTLVNQPTFDRLLELNPNKELIKYDPNKPIYPQILDRAILLDKKKSPGNVFETNAIMRLLLSAFFIDHSHPQAMNTLYGLNRFENVLKHIQEYLSTPIAVPQLAKMANLNPAYFSDLFGKLIGIPPLQYMHKRRIEKAQELLLCTDETLKQIAQQVGFKDGYYFSRIFKKTVGLSPHHYRKQERLNHQR